MSLEKKVKNRYDVSEILKRLLLRVNKLEKGTNSTGDFIPLTGTEVGSPITGRLNIETDLSLDSIQFPIYVKNLAKPSNSLMLSSFISPGQQYPAIVFNDGASRGFISYVDKSFHISADVDDGTNTNSKVNIKGLLNNPSYLLSRYTDYSYVQKKYVDDNFAKFGTIAPLSATDTGTMGEIRVTPTFIYTCVATDTWVRAAVSTW